MLDLDLADESEALRRCVPDEDAPAERALWLSVIHQAVIDARGGTTIDSKSARRQNRLQAIEWLSSNRRDVGSLAWIIDMTGLQTTQEAIRAAVVKPTRKSA